MSRLSATMALAPPGPRSLAIVVNKCARSTNRSFMEVKGGGGCVQEQDCLSYRYQVVITNSHEHVVETSWFAFALLVEGELFSEE